VTGVRVVQLTDTHFSHRLGVPAQWPAVVAWLRDDPPDLVVHTGDIVYEDPDDDADRAFAGELLDQLTGPPAIIPGNHDIGFYGEDDDRERRLDAFRSAWGGDRFVADLAGWRLVGADAYLLGTDEHDQWLASAVTTSGPVAVFVHQPVAGEPADGWEMPEPARAAFARAVAGVDVRVIASGHRHRWRTLGPAVWAPSLTLVGDEHGDGSDPRPGLVEHRFSPTGEHHHRVVRPWEPAVSG
jgi:3',5'-cyclic AMP phosphodiesterase CpdA